MLLLEGSNPKRFLMLSSIGFPPLQWEGMAEASLGLMGLELVGL